MPHVAADTADTWQKLLGRKRLCVACLGPDGPQCHLKRKLSRPPPDFIPVAAKYATLGRHGTSNIHRDADGPHRFRFASPTGTGNPCYRDTEVGAASCACAGSHLARFAHVDPASTNPATIVEGVDMVEKKMLKTLGAAGLEIVNPTSERFDPARHEAVSIEITTTAEEDGQVARVFQPGYLFNGQLLRPARVVVKQHNG